MKSAVAETRRLAPARVLRQEENLENGTQWLPLLVGNSVEVGILKGWCTGQSRHLQLTYSDKVLTGEGWFYWDAFVSLRRQLEASDVQPICYGTCIDMHPGGLALDWSSGLLTNRQVPGQYLSEGHELFYIFDSAADLKPSTVDEQKQYFAKWKESLRERRDASNRNKQQVSWLAKVLSRLRQALSSQ